MPSKGAGDCVQIDGESDADMQEEQQNDSPSVLDAFGLGSMGRQAARFH